MGRRIVFDRSVLPADVLSATEEYGLVVDAPSGDLAGLMEMFVGGSPPDGKDLYCDIIRTGNLGNAEWGFTPTTETKFFGCNAPWIAERYQGMIDNDNVGTQLRVKRFDEGRDILAALFFTEGTVLKARFYDPVDETWTIATNVTAASPTSASPADCLMFTDTLEVIVFCDGTLYSADGDNYEDGSKYFVKSDYGSWNSAATSVSLAYSRGQLILTYQLTGKMYTMVSRDRGASWETPVAVSDNFLSGETVNQVDSVHTVVGYADQNFYAVVEDDTDGSGNSDDVKIYRSPDGLEWVQGLHIAANDALNPPSLTAMEDGRFAVFYSRSDAKLFSYWLTSSLGYERPRGGALDSYGSVVAMDSGANRFSSFNAVDLGDQMVGLIEYAGTGTYATSVITCVLRRWANITEIEGNGLPGWLNTLSDKPSDGWGWSETIAATGTPTKSQVNLQIETSGGAGTGKCTYSYTTGSAKTHKIRWRVKCGNNCNLANRRVGLRLQYENAAAKGFDAGVYFDTSEVRIYDNQAGAFLGASAVSVDLTEKVEFLLEIEPDETNGGAELHLWIKEDTADKYPYDPYTLAIDVTTSQSAPLGANQSKLEWGNFSNVAAATTTSYWYYVVQNDEAEAFDGDYKDTAADHSSQRGKFCSHLSQGLVSELSAWFRGAGGYKDDRWTISGRYVYEKANVNRADPKRQWRTEDDEQDVNIVFYNGRIMGPDWLTIFRKNFAEFFVDIDRAVTFNSTGGNPDFTVRVGDGSNVADQAIYGPSGELNINSIDLNALTIASTDARTSAMWAGRFDRDAISGKRWFVKIVNGGAAGEVYRILETRMTFASGNRFWTLVLADTAAGVIADPTGDGVSQNDDCVIFGEDIAVDIGAVNNLGYDTLYMRIRIPSQKTWDGDYRIGTVIYGSSIPFRDIRAMEVRDAEYGASLSMEPNVAVVVAPDGTVVKRRKGRGRRLIQLSWTGQGPREAWMSAVRSMLEAASSDVPISFMENDSFEHTGPTTPSSTIQVCYEPILCYVVGTISASQFAYQTFDPNDGETGMRGDITDIGAVVLEEIV